MAEGDCIPNLDCEIKEENLNEGIRKVVQKLRPTWDLESLVIENNSSGYMNVNYAVTSGSGCSDGLFVRLINAAVPEMMEMTVNTMLYLKRRRLGAQLLLTFKNGLVMELLLGQSVKWNSVQQLRKPEVWLGLAREIARYHGTTNQDDIKEFGIVPYDQANEMYRDEIKRCAKAINFDMKANGLPDVDEILDINNKIYESLFEDGATLAFCHMDANPTNVIITKDGPVLIDYEFCCYDMACVNIATLFGSMSDVLVYNVADLPNDEEKEIFVREYLKARYELDPKFGKPTDEMVKHWMFMIKKATLSFYLTGVCGVIMVKGLGTKDVDINLTHTFNNLFKENKSILYMKYSKV